MKVLSIPIERLREAQWNPNRMDPSMLSRLRQSLIRYGTVENLVVRVLGDGTYETLSGNQRLRVLTDMGVIDAPCVVVDLDDGEARLLAQALNSIEGEDDLGLKAELVRELLESIPQHEVLALLPESTESLAALASLGESDLAEQLQSWEQAQGARLHHMTFQLASDQVEIVAEAMDSVMGDEDDEGSNPNRRGNALFRICREHLDVTGGEEQ